MGYLKLLAVVVVAIASTGCLRITNTLNLKADGSGTVVTTFAMSKAMMQQAAAMMGGSMLPTEAKLREGAAAMGAVRFVSATPYSTAGFEGLTAVYAFDDVNQVKLNLEQAIVGSLNAPVKPSMDSEADVKLAFKREGDRTVLLLRMPEVSKPDAETAAHVETAAKQAESSPQVEAMMKQLLDGLLIEVAFNIEGQILQTNAPFVEGQRIVLAQLNGNEVLKSGMGLMQIVQLGGATGDFKSKLSQVPGLKIVMLPELRVEFR